MNGNYLVMAYIKRNGSFVGLSLVGMNKVNILFLEFGICAEQPPGKLLACLCDLTLSPTTHLMFKMYFV